MLFPEPSRIDAISSPTPGGLLAHRRISLLIPVALPLGEVSAHDREPWPGVIDGVPSVFRPWAGESALAAGGNAPVVTPDCAEWLFHLLMDRSPEAYQRFAEDLEAVQDVLMESVRSAIRGQVAIRHDRFIHLPEVIAQGVGFGRPWLTSSAWWL